MATLALGPRYGLLDNASIGQSYVDSFRLFLQSIDCLIYVSSINTTTVIPPSSPSAGDTYLLLSTPSGTWTGNQNNVAYWNSQNTNAGTNTLSPSWLFIAPKPGMLVYDQSSTLFYLYSAGAWTSLNLTGLTTPVSIANGGTGANNSGSALSNLGAAKNGLNTDITSLGGITGVSIASNSLSVMGAVSGGLTVNSGGVQLSGYIQTFNGGGGPTVAVKPGAGSGASASLGTGSTNTAGLIILTTGTSPTANSEQVAITFGTAFASNNIFVLLSPADVSNPVFVGSSSSLGFFVYSQGTPLAESTTTGWNYLVIQGAS